MRRSLCPSCVLKDTRLGERACNIINNLAVDPSDKEDQAWLQESEYGPEVERALAFSGVKRCAKIKHALHQDVEPTGYEACPEMALIARVGIEEMLTAEAAETAEAKQISS